MTRSWGTLVAGLASVVAMVLPIAGGDADRAEAAALGPMEIRGVEVGERVTPSLSPPVWRLLRAPDAGAPRQVPSGRTLPPPRWAPGNVVGPEDPLLAPARAAATGARTPSPSLVFNGIGSDGGTPPDPVGDVGPNHYVQMVNTRFQIFDKAGASLGAPVDINTLWAGAGGRCEVTNDGDPIVLYDALADRWLLAQFAITGSPDALCVAISATPDPTGSYFRYEFEAPVFPDYLKFGVWPDAYYVTTNDVSGAGTGDVGVYALDRTQMLAGNPATSQRFPVLNVNLLLPADLDGFTAPPAGAPNLLYTFSDSATWGGAADRLDLYEFHVDFGTPANSTLALVQSIPITAFTYTVCGYFDFSCGPQPAPGELIDVVSEWPMFRFPYRNFGTHETLVGNFTVDVGSDRAGIRWFELRRSGGGAWSLQQEGTHAPGTEHRFMGSIAMDGSGNIALGYTASSASLNPSARYATRLATDPAGTLQTEVDLQAGGGVQTGGGNRWGDYSAMSIDPADDCTFWYTSEYYAATSAKTWSTTIGRFRLPECVSHPEIEPDASALSFGLAPLDTTVTRTLTLRNVGGAALTLASLALGGSSPAQFALASNGCSGQSVDPGETCSVDVQFHPGDGGPLSATLSVPSNDADENPLVVTLSGTGDGPEVLVGPAAVDFGSVPAGGQVTRTVTVQNVGTRDLVLDSVKLGLGRRGDPAFRTPRQGHGCAREGVLAPGDSCTIDVTLRPPGPGAHASALVIRSGDANEPEVEIPLTGAGAP